MSVTEPRIKGSIINRYNFMSDYMDYPIEIIIENKNGDNYYIHFRTIPPGMSHEQFKYWYDVIYDKKEILEINRSKLWISLLIEYKDVEEVKELADYSSEVYYDIYNHHDV